MIVVYLNQESFSYDIHSLVKAFYPPENVCVCAEKKNLTEEVELWIGVEFDLDVSLQVRIPQGKKATVRKEGHKVFYDYDFSAWEIADARKFSVDYGDRKETKNRLKQELYQMLSKLTGQQLPWGTLTGIRPTKFALEMLEQGKDKSDIRKFMSEKFYTPSDKIELSIRIAEREWELLQQVDYEHGYSLYIGIPFCPSTCLYCSFPSYALSLWRERVDDYLDALEKEIDFCAERMKGRNLNTVYIGGGTPTTLSTVQLERLLVKIKKAFEINRMPNADFLKNKLNHRLNSCDVLEFTVEAGRPDSITEEKLSVLKEQGVSRISINPQTMKQATLDLIGRRHKVGQVVDSFRLARKLGFDNINMDLIMGLPEETLEDVHNTLEAIRELGPDSLTVHSLAVKRAAKLNMFREDYAGMQMVNTPRHLELAARYCEGMDMAPYYLYRQKNMAGNFENVGYAKPGKAGVYNVLIMEEKQTILALGAGATSKIVTPVSDPDAAYPLQIERIGNVKDVGTYIDRVDEMIARKAECLQRFDFLGGNNL